MSKLTFDQVESSQAEPTASTKMSQMKIVFVIVILPRRVVFETANETFVHSLSSEKRKIIKIRLWGLTLGFDLTRTEMYKIHRDRWLCTSNVRYVFLFYQLTVQQISIHSEHYALRLYTVTLYRINIDPTYRPMRSLYAMKVDIRNWKTRTRIVAQSFIGSD